MPTDHGSPDDHYQEALRLLDNLARNHDDLCGYHDNIVRARNHLRAHHDGTAVYDIDAAVNAARDHDRARHDDHVVATKHVASTSTNDSNTNIYLCFHDDGREHLIVGDICPEREAADAQDRPDAHAV